MVPLSGMSPSSQQARQRPNRTPEVARPAQRQDASSANQAAGGIFQRLAPLRRPETSSTAPTEAGQAQQKASPASLNAGLLKASKQGISNCVYSIINAPRELMAVSKRDFAVTMGISIASGLASAVGTIGSVYYSAQVAGLASPVSGISVVVGTFLLGFTVDTISGHFLNRYGVTISEGMRKNLVDEIHHRPSHTAKLKGRAENLQLAFNKVAGAGQVVTAFSRVVSISLSAAVLALQATAAGATPALVGTGGLILGALAGYATYVSYKHSHFQMAFSAGTKQLSDLNSQLSQINQSRALRLGGGLKLLERQRDSLSDKLASEKLSLGTQLNKFSMGTAVVVAACFYGALNAVQMMDSGLSSMLLAGVVTSLMYQTFPLVYSLNGLSEYADFLKSYTFLRKLPRETRVDYKELKSPAVGIEARNLSFAFNAEDVERRRVILENASFKVDPGEFAVIFAPEGTGKTTLLDLMATIQKPASGGITILDGEERVALRDLDDQKWLDRYAGRATQKPDIYEAFTLRDNLLAKISVDSREQRDADNDMQAGKKNGSLSQADEELLHKLLDAVGKPQWKDMLDEKLGEESRGTVLSGGESQIVALIRTLMTRPKILFLDEPFSALSQESAARLIRLVTGLKTHGILDFQPTVVMVTHDTRQAELADTIVYIKDGGRITQGTHASLLAQESSYRRNVFAFQQPGALYNFAVPIPDASTLEEHATGTV